MGCRLWGRTESDTTEATQQQQQQQQWCPKGTRQWMTFMGEVVEAFLPTSDSQKGKRNEYFEGFGQIVRWKDHSNFHSHQQCTGQCIFLHLFQNRSLLFCQAGYESTRSLLWKPSPEHILSCLRCSDSNAWLSEMKLGILATVD